MSISPAQKGKKDAGVDSGSDSSADAPHDAISDVRVTDVSSDVTLDIGVGDAPHDAPIADVSSDAVSSFCGDGIRDPATEECDDGVSDPLSACTSICTVRDLLAYETLTDASAVQRTLGLGRHPIGADGNGYAVAWVQPSIPDVYATFYNEKGVEQKHVDHVGVSSTCLTSSAPVLAAVSGKYAAAWTDYGGDGDAEGIAIRLVDPTTNSSGSPGHANTTTALSQMHPDVIWTGTSVVVAWEDWSNWATAPDIKYRTFDSTFTPTSTEQSLAVTTAYEEDVALAVFGTGWVAAWRSATSGLESIEITTSTSVSWSVGPFLPGPYDSAPAVTELDSTHLLLVYTEGTDTTDAGVANQSHIRGAVLDTASPGSVTPFDITTITVTDAGASPSTYFANAVTVGSRYYIAWGSAAVTADPNAEELWLKEVKWSGSLDLSISEVHLPRWDSHRPGDQRTVALAASPLGPGGALVSGWYDLGQVLSGESTEDVVTELIPVPMLRLTTIVDGGGL